MLIYYKMNELKNEQLRLIALMEDPPKYPNGQINNNKVNIILNQIQQIEKQIKKGTN